MSVSVTFVKKSPQAIGSLRRRGGGGGSRTRVLKQVRTNFSGCSLWSEFPRGGVHKQPPPSGSFICHAMLKALHSHVHC